MDESFNPWTVVNVVFHHLAAQGLHPTLGAADPGAPAAALLRALGIEPVIEGDRRTGERVRRELDEIREAMFGEAKQGGADSL
ncbi:hypothetical protein [Dactylosporangium sp. CS-033363]|uniref:hypothetical protein n=1 Tax=Dactylosporangium sp. CS-033363 TaxID=3239935 RepID=UPI003D90ED22